MSVDGTWKVIVSSPMGKEETTLEVRTEGGSLAGTQSGRQESNPIKDAKLDGENFSWLASVAKPFPMTLEFKAVVSGNTMNGKVKAGSFGSFDFIGSRA